MKQLGVWLLPSVWDVTPSEAPPPRALFLFELVRNLCHCLFILIGAGQGRQARAESSIFLKAQLTSARHAFGFTRSRFQQATLFVQICTSRSVVHVHLNFFYQTVCRLFTLAHSNVYFPVVIKQQTTVTDKVKHRLEDLNDFEEVTDLALLHYVAPENIHTPPMTGLLV